MRFSFECVPERRDLHHGFECDVSFRQTLESGIAITLAVQIPAEFGDGNNGFTDRGRFFLSEQLDHFDFVGIEQFVGG